VVNLSRNRISALSQLPDTTFRDVIVDRHRSSLNLTTHGRYRQIQATSSISMNAVASAARSYRRTKDRGSRVSMS
jgi:hypothetical protein